MPLDKDVIWHYAVFKGSSRYYMEAACVSNLDDLDHNVSQGLCRYRGHVTCPDCLKAMGPS